jgi:hypothetical protein
MCIQSVPRFSTFSDMRRAVGLGPTGEKSIFVERLESVSSHLNVAMEHSGMVSSK